ncbi:MAG TPA: LuxR C-terminal-related transcriptional regulator [Burkholderiaceae bacterium]|nr:LuxR C-terminal-related transcriptional regulator [Burkholderiaceae bacterium]
MINEPVHTPAMRGLPMTRPSKFTPPGEGDSFVHRAALDACIARAGPAKVVLVRAPAGFGKTTALRQIQKRMDATGIATAWITIDESDNDIQRFLGCLAEAVSQLQIDDRNTQVSGADALAALSREGPAFALFMDEFELLQVPAVVGVIRDIVQHLPRGGQLVIGSRSVPDIGLPRLRVRGHLVEVDAEMLRFGLDETSRFFALSGVDTLNAEDIQSLHARTEGWIAALVLASMALRRYDRPQSFVGRLFGASGAIGEYLAEEVLARQPLRSRDFLLRTSILAELNPGLCRHLLGDADAVAMLDRVHAEGLFLSKLEEPGPEPIFQYHRLFSTFLQAQLGREHPDDVPTLHRRASEWFESAGRYAPAIDHALEGRDFERAIRLLTAHALRYLERGRMRLLERWLSALPPDDVLRHHPLIQVLHAWAGLFTRGAAEAMKGFVESGLQSSADPAIRAHVNALRPLLLTMMDRYDEAYEVGQACLARLPTPVPFADAVLTNCMAHVSAVIGDLREARRLLNVARRTQGSSALNRMYAEATEGMFDKERGRLRQAMARFQTALEATTSEDDANQTSGNAWAGVLYASTLYEANALDAVERLLQVYLPLASEMGLPDHIISSYVIRSHIQFWRGDVDQSFRVLTELESLGYARDLARVVATARLQRGRLLILQGNRAGAREEIDRADEPEVWQRVERLRLPAHDILEITLARMRWDAHFGDAAKVIARIDGELPRLRVESRIRRVRKLSVLKIIALWRLNRRDLATAVARDLVIDGHREGFMRLMLDEGPLVLPAVEAVIQELNASDRADPTLIEYAHKLRGSFGPYLVMPESHPAGTHDLPPYIEALTQKELEVLRLVAEGYSNSAMAEKLQVSDSTIRTHLRSINLKLDAQSRTQAVSIARKYRILG